ncbi:MAG TPA: hypothetical protein P5228_09195 [Bacteroidales bacterium]|nr:hypothetical protein [Bacteroidales bacterium]
MTTITKHDTEQLLKSLKLIPGYAKKIAEQTKTSEVTVYRVLKGTLSPKSFSIFDCAADLVHDFETSSRELSEKIKRLHRSDGPPQVTDN